MSKITIMALLFAILAEQMNKVFEQKLEKLYQAFVQLPGIWSSNLRCVSDK